jgi:TonB family protein
MKFILKIFFITFLFISCSSVAQVDTTNKEKILVLADEMPSFPGGETELQKFVQNNLKYPVAEKAANVMGKCYITFVVEKDGHLNNVKLLKGITGGPGCDEEAMRVVMLMPKWIPGKQNNKEARVQVNLPLQFRLSFADSITETDTTYFNSAWKKSSKAEATFYRTVLKHDNGFLVKDLYIKNNLPQMIAVCNSLNPLKRNGKTTYYYETGQKQEEGVFILHEKDGVWTSWYENGQKKLEATYAHGKPNSTWEEWFENGQKKISDHFADGNHHGIRMEWEEDGKDSSVMESFVDGTYRNIRISKNRATVHPQYDVFYPVEVGAEFPGGEKAMQEFIIKEIDRIGYPRAERRTGVSGTVYVTFVVEKDGTLTDIKLLRGVSGGPGYDALALEVIKRMPTWKSGIQFGKVVRVQFNLPIRFTLR